MPHFENTHHSSPFDPFMRISSPFAAYSSPLHISLPSHASMPAVASRVNRCSIMLRCTPGIGVLFIIHSTFRFLSVHSSFRLFFPIFHAFKFIHELIVFARFVVLVHIIVG
ncbi:hypothetical protein C8R44DRAFT_866056 [Mycena epipterygia]|nr:hypothetical protein C8R44DRAFT_866056 [Mycena epipterygia]